jgi:tripartite-type tricarboxylate transporter receptor subunit TctC
MRSSRTFRVVLAALALACALPAFAQYPDRVIRGVVPFPPGGGTDIFARLVAERAGKLLGQPIVIENRPGAEGNIGMDGVAKAPADGYTILFNSSAATVNPAMYRKLPFDPIRDLAPVAVLCEYPNLVVVNATKVPAKSLGEFMDLLRKNPGKYNAAAGGTRIVYELFRLQQNVDILIVPYKGAGDAINGLLAGDVDFMIVNAPGLTQHIASGRLRALAITADKRQPDFPDVPTTAEAGMPEFVYGSFFGAYVRGGTSPDIVRRLNAVFNEVSALPEVVERFRSLGATATQKSVEEANRQYQGDIARIKDVVQKAKVPQLD